MSVHASRLTALGIPYTVKWGLHYMRPGGAVNAPGHGTRRSVPMHHERIVRPLPERFWAKVDKTHPSGCWVWTAALCNGYGMFGFNGMRAHRLAYIELVGEIPAGLVIDHLCRNRACVNPAHMEPVTNRENILRGVGIVAQCAAKTHCPKGHPYDEANTWMSKAGSRHCRTCKNAKDRARRAAAAALREPRSPASHCARGHAFDEGNTYIVPGTGHRTCKTCVRERRQQQKAARQEAA